MLSLFEEEEVKTAKVESNKVFYLEVQMNNCCAVFYLCINPNFILDFVNA